MATNHWILCLAGLVLIAVLTTLGMDDARLGLWTFGSFAGVALLLMSAGWLLRMRRWLYAAAIVATAVWALLNGITDVLAVWWRGGDTDELVLGFTTVMWWGRIGKALQFAAGLVVLLDLVDTTRLRAAGAWAADRQRAIGPAIDGLSNAVVYIQAEDWLVCHVVSDRQVLGPPMGGVQHVMRGDAYLVSPDRTVPDWAPFTQEDYLELHRRFAAGMDGEITWEQRMKLREMAREIVERELTAGQVAELKRVRKQRKLLDDKLVPIGITIFMAWILAVVTGLLPAPADWFLLTLGLTGMGLVVVATISPGTLYERWLGALYLPLRFTTEGLARLLDRDRPAHPLRWLGLFIFVYGFALDLLAS